MPLGNRAVGSDILGDAYEDLIGRFADITRRKKAGEFYTPRSVVRMVVELLDPREGESIYDPVCGTGGMLLGAIEHVVAAPARCGRRTCGAARRAGCRRPATATTPGCSSSAARSGAAGAGRSS